MLVIGKISGGMSTICGRACRDLYMGKIHIESILGEIDVI